MSVKPEIKIALYGGTDLAPQNAAFVCCLARAFLADQHVVLIGGGIYDSSGKKTSVDKAAYDETIRFVQEHGQSVEDRLQTWLTREGRPGIERARWGTPVDLDGSALSRRFQVVNGVDALVTIEGEGETALVLELAIALNRVALPIGFTGTDSARFWKPGLERDHFVKQLDLAPSLVDRLGRVPQPAEMQELADDVATAVLRKAERRCLVLMDFEDLGHREFFERVLTPAVEAKGFRVHRLDRAEFAGDILELFLARLNDCHAIVADVTGWNPNVLYELGRVHHHNRVKPLILCRRQEAAQDVPFYLSKHLIHWLNANDTRVIEEYLLGQMKGRQERASV